MIVLHNSISRWFFHWSLTDSKSFQISRTHLSILADLNNVVAWMVSIYPLIFMSFSRNTNSLVTVLSTPFTICIIITLMFHGFVSTLARSRYLSLFSVSFSFIVLLARTASFFFLLRGQVIWLRLDDPSVSQNPREFVHLIFLEWFWVVHIPFICIAKFKLLAQSCQVLYCFWPNLLIHLSCDLPFFYYYYYYYYHYFTPCKFLTPV